MLVLDFSEDKRSKRARKNDDEVDSMLLKTLDGPDNANYSKSCGRFYLSITAHGYRISIARLPVVCGLCL